VLPIRALARFWSVALGWPITIDETDEVVIEPPADDPAQEGQIPLVFVPVPEPKTTKNRIHLDWRRHPWITSAPWSHDAGVWRPADRHRSARRLVGGDRPGVHAHRQAPGA
jgi:hypothetical protein